MSYLVKFNEMDQSGLANPHPNVLSKDMGEELDGLLGKISERYGVNTFEAARALSWYYSKKKF